MQNQTPGFRESLPYVMAYVAELVLERAVVGAGVELPMLGEHDTVDGALLVAQLDPVEVGLQGSAAVFRGLAVAVQIEDCGHLHDVLTSPGET